MTTYSHYITVTIETGKVLEDEQMDALFEIEGVRSVTVEGLVSFAPEELDFKLQDEPLEAQIEVMKKKIEQVLK